MPLHNTHHILLLALHALNEKKIILGVKKGSQNNCAAKAFYYCPSMISHRPRSQNISKESTLNLEKDSSIKRPRSHISSEKSSQNYKPLEN
jgi:hypothetical protein